jgi:hypothetical protein
MTVQPTSRITRGTALVGGLLIDGDESSPAGVINLVPRVVKIPLTLRSTGAHDTGVDLPTAGVVLDIWLDITTAESTGSTKTINVGLLAGEAGGDADGFIAGASTAAAVTVKHPGCLVERNPDRLRFGNHADPRCARAQRDR